MSPTGRHGNEEPTLSTGEIERALTAAQRALDEGRGLAGTGFWKAVSVVKADPVLVETYASRIATLDRRAFLRWARVSVPGKVGTTLMGFLTLVGIALVAWAPGLDSPWNGLVLLGGGGGILVMTTHGLGHMVVGRLVGIRFTHWFVGSIQRPQPGVKVDYDTYLRASPRSRAWMHASGALVTKVVPFALLPLVSADFPEWATWLLVGQGVLQILADALWSVKMSDWKKFRRELSYA